MVEHGRCPTCRNTYRLVEGVMTPHFRAFGGECPGAGKAPSQKMAYVECQACGRGEWMVKVPEIDGESGVTSAQNDGLSEAPCICGGPCECGRGVQYRDGTSDG